MTTLTDIQRALLARGFDVGKAGADGLLGPSTLDGMLAALERLPLAPTVTVPARPVTYRVVPAEWMPWAQMTRIVFHWTAGHGIATSFDRLHYHILIEADDNLVRGLPSIAANDAPLKPGYAAHTANLNGDAIGVALCGMAGAQEKPFRAGGSPINTRQWDMLGAVLADLCRRYAIPVTRKTVLSHAEVQPTLGVAQRGKWDIARLPWDGSTADPVEIGDRMRAMVAARL